MCRIVPFEASFWAGADPRTLLATSPSRVENIDRRGCDAYGESEYLVENVLRFAALARSEHSIGSLFRATSGHPARSHRYRELNKAQGLGDELRGVFRSGRGVWVSYRCTAGTATHRSARPRERLLARLNTTIGDTFRRSTLTRP